MYTSLEQVKEDCLSCVKCDLGKIRQKTNKKVVWARGNPEAKILILGEAPGAEEAETGLPFVGLSGKELQKFLERVGLADKVYITNPVKCRPPENRDPTDEELSQCYNWIALQIQFIKPEIIIAVGNVPLYWLTQKFGGITKKRGKWLKWQRDSMSAMVMPVFHPSFLARNRYRATEEGSPHWCMWHDLVNVKKALEAKVYEDTAYEYLK